MTDSLLIALTGEQRFFVCRDVWRCDAMSDGLVLGGADISEFAVHDLP